MHALYGLSSCLQMAVGIVIQLMAYFELSMWMGVLSCTFVVTDGVIPRQPTQTLWHHLD